MTAQRNKVRNQLTVVSWLAGFDAGLLALLVSAALLHAQAWVHILGPLHGINYLLLLASVILPALDGVWGWWFPLLVFFTAGPIGAYIGERRIQRSFRHENAH